MYCSNNPPFLHRRYYRAGHCSIYFTFSWTTRRIVEKVIRRNTKNKSHSHSRFVKLWRFGIPCLWNPSGVAVYPQYLFRNGRFRWKPRKSLPKGRSLRRYHWASKRTGYRCKQCKEGGYCRRWWVSCTGSLRFTGTCRFNWVERGTCFRRWLWSRGAM